MKKSIKYAGIAAATLLTLAPVVAPVVGTTTQTVQADSVTPTNDKSAKQDISDYLTTFKDDTNFVASNLTGSIDKYYGQEMTAKDFQDSNNAFNNLHKFSVTNKKDLSNVEITVTAKDSENGKSLTGTDFKQLLNTEKTFYITLAVSYENGSFKTSDSKTFTITQDLKEAVAKHHVTSLNAEYTTPYAVTLNSKVSDAQLTRSFDLKLTDQNGNDVKYNIEHVGKIYDHVQDAVAGSPDKELSINKFSEKGQKYYEAYELVIADKDLGADSKTTTTGGKSSTTFSQVELQKLKDNYNIKVNGTEALNSQLSFVSDEDGTTLDKEGNYTDKPVAPATEVKNGRHVLRVVRQITVGESEKPAVDWDVK